MNSYINDNWIELVLGLIFTKDLRDMEYQQAYMVRLKYLLNRRHIQIQILEMLVPLSVMEKIAAVATQVVSDGSLALDKQEL